VWQRYWEQRNRSFTMLAAAQDVQGETRVAPVVGAADVSFPVLVDRTSVLARVIGFRVVPSGIFVDESGVVRYRHVDDFDIADPRVRMNLDRFLAGESVQSPRNEVGMSRDALDLFAEGVGRYRQGDPAAALAKWRAALMRDPDNFVIRSQIWAVEHPEHFYPSVDREWQSMQLLREGYDKPLP
jgi:hypothetical protein